MTRRFYQWSRAQEKCRLNRSLSLSQGRGNIHFSLEKAEFTLRLHAALHVLMEGCIAGDADIIFCALIFLSVGLTSLVAAHTSGWNSQGREEGPADVPCVTRLLTLH